VKHLSTEAFSSWENVCHVVPNNTEDKHQVVSSVSRFCITSHNAV